MKTKRITKRINYATNEQEWKLEKKLKEKGFTKTGECYWLQTFEKGNKIIILSRE